MRWCGDCGGPSQSDHTAWCDDCGRERARRAKENPDPAPGFKYCSRCGDLFIADLEHFAKKTASKDGLSSYCRPCSREVRLVSYYKNRGENLRANLKPKAKYRGYVNGAKQRELVWDITFEQFMGFWQKPCTYCGVEIATIGIDRVDPNIGYELDNLVPCCSFCNRMKWAMTAEVFLLHVVTIARHMQKKGNFRRVMDR